MIHNDDFFFHTFGFTKWQLCLFIYQICDFISLYILQYIFTIATIHLTTDHFL